MARLFHQEMFKKRKHISDELFVKRFQKLQKEYREKEEDEG